MGHREFESASEHPGQRPHATVTAATSAPTLTTTGEDTVMIIVFVVAVITYTVYAALAALIVWGLFLLIRHLWRLARRSGN